MTHIASPKRPRRLTPYLIGLSLLVLPLVGNILSDEVNWSPLDFVVAAATIMLAVGLFDLIGRSVAPLSKRLPYYALVGALMLYLWAELAVGIFFDIGS